MLVVVAAAAASYDTPIPILKDDRALNPDGSYSFDFKTGNGIERSESGRQVDGQESSGAFR